MERSIPRQRPDLTTEKIGRTRQGGWGQFAASVLGLTSTLGLRDDVGKLLPARVQIAIREYRSATFGWGLRYATTPATLPHGAKQVGSEADRDQPSGGQTEPDK